MSCYQVNTDTIDLLSSVFFWGNEQHQQPFFVSDSKPITGELQELMDSNREDYALIGSVAKQLTIMQAIAEELIQTNMDSVLFRYNDDESMISYERENYNQEPIRQYDGLATIPQVLGAIACYEYQSCERPDWATSWAHDYCQYLRKALCSQLATGWEYEKPADAPRWIAITDMV